VDPIRRQDAALPRRPVLSGRHQWPASQAHQNTARGRLLACRVHTNQYWLAPDQAHPPGRRDWPFRKEDASFAQGQCP